MRSAGVTLLLEHHCVFWNQTLQRHVLYILEISYIVEKEYNKGPSKRNKTRVEPRVGVCNKERFSGLGFIKCKS